MESHNPQKTRVAWITFDFPPRQSSGVFRAIKFYKYLDKSRFEVDFITHGPTRRFRRAIVDESLLAEVHPLPAVHRVPTVIPHDLLLALGAALARRRKSSGGRGEASAPSNRRPEAPTSARRPGLAGRCYRWFAFAAYFPDHLFVWGWLAGLRAVALHFRRRFDLIYTTSYPESAHLAGLLLRLLGVKWVADYRYGGPLWIKHIVGYRKSALRERMDHWFQRRVLRSADLIITQSERIRADFCRTFGLAPERVIVLPSGYDEADFANVRGGAAPISRRDHEVHLLHVGTLEGVAEPERAGIVRTLDGLGRLLARRGWALRVHAVGSDFVTATEQASVGGFDYRHHGVIVHSQIPSYLMAADCYLLSAWTTSNGGVKGFIPSKLWEYLRAGRPILMTGPKDEVWSIVEDAAAGVYMPLTEEKAALEQLADELLGRVTERATLHTRVRHYSWESRARTLEALLASIAPQSQVAPAGGQALV